jgi:hypothetical protein
VFISQQLHERRSWFPSFHHFPPDVRFFVFPAFLYLDATACRNIPIFEFFSQDGKCAGRALLTDRGTDADFEV